MTIVIDTPGDADAERELAELLDNLIDEFGVRSENVDVTVGVLSDGRVEAELE